VIRPPAGLFVAAALLLGMRYVGPIQEVGCTVRVCVSGTRCGTYVIYPLTGKAGALPAELFAAVPKIESVLFSHLE
jgi:hypothetical protein